MKFKKGVWQRLPRLCALLLRYPLLLLNTVTGLLFGTSRRAESCRTFSSSFSRAKTGCETTKLAILRHIPVRLIKMDTTDEQKDDSMEIIADPSNYVTLPIQNERIWRKYQTSLDFWTVYEVNIDKDRASMLETLNPEQCQLLQKVIALMLLTHDNIVTKELFLDLINQVEIKEAAYFFGSQVDTKKTHRMMYSMLLDELAGDAEKSVKLNLEVALLPEVNHALMWYFERITMEEESFAKRMLTFATLQGILFTVPFILFSWIEHKHPSKLSGLMKSNHLIWRDERLNFGLSCMLLSEIEDEVEIEEAIEIVKTAVQHAKNIFMKALPVSTLGIDVNLMGQFIEYSADILLSETHNKKVYHVETPFDWIIEPKIDTNETALTNVVMATTSATDNGDAFGFDEDF